MSADLINGLVHIGAGLLQLHNIHRLYRDRQWRGVHWAPPAYFFAWGLWDLYYWPSLNQWWSFSAGLFVMLVVGWRLILMYRFREKPDHAMEI